MTERRYFSVECEAPGGFGPDAVLRYDPTGSFVQDVDYLDLYFEVWLGGDLVTHMAWYGISAQMWAKLASKLRGVSARKMTVTPGWHFYAFDPQRTIPKFCELILARCAEGVAGGKEQMIVGATIPKNTDMFTGFGLRLVVTEHAKAVLCDHGISPTLFAELSVQ